MTTKLLFATIIAAPAFIGGAAALQLSPAAAEPIDHCKPRSACICEWQTINGKQQYVCRVIKQPR